MWRFTGTEKRIDSYEQSTGVNSNTVSEWIRKYSEVKMPDMAAYCRRNPQGLMFHSDRGCQYTAFSFRKFLDNCSVVQSFSKKGHPYDNAVAESFFKFLKHEETNRRNYQTLKELELSVFQYIEGYYNSKRPHAGLSYLTPNQAEKNFSNRGLRNIN